MKLQIDVVAPQFQLRLKNKSKETNWRKNV